MLNVKSDVVSRQTLEDDDQPFGWHLMLDLHQCDVRRFGDPDEVREFAARLVELIDMRRFGDPWVQRFGAPGSTAEGLTLVQLIETSSLVVHFSEALRTLYLDLFSCKRFDPSEVADFTCRYFSGATRRAEFTERR